jgi:hypothetical protein
MPKRRPSFQYDAALSFAGEDREHAEALAEKLKDLGFTVFYDKDHQAHLWGKNQTEYEKIYGPESRYVIPLISEHCVRKDWTRFEFEIAKGEARKRAGEFILPVKLDGTRLLGLHDDLNFLQLGSLSIGEIAQEFAKKCDVSRATKTKRRRSRHSGRKERSTVTLLSREARHALGLIATSLRSVWISTLEPLRHHVDLAACLSLHYVRENRWDDAVRVLADVADGLVLGHWNGLYLNGSRSYANMQTAIAYETRWARLTSTLE